MKQDIIHENPHRMDKISTLAQKTQDHSSGLEEVIQLGSIIINLCALRPGVLLNSSGVAVHGALFNNIPAELGKLLHDPSDENNPSGKSKPFTVSPIMDLPPGRKGVAGFDIGQTAWFRVTTLNHSSTLSILEETACWVKDGQELDIGGTIWKVTGRAAQPEEHPLASVSSYQGLMDQGRSNAHPPGVWNLRFLTPMTLRGEHFCFPFPQPKSLINSWLSSWNAYAPFQLPQDLVDLARLKLAVESYCLKTVLVSDLREPFPGCLGEITLRSHGIPDTLRFYLDILFRYAFFCGTGYKTPQGMGQTMLLTRKDRSSGGAKGGVRSGN